MLDRIRAATLSLIGFLAFVAPALAEDGVVGRNTAAIRERGSDRGADDAGSVEGAGGAEKQSDADVAERLDSMRRRAKSLTCRIGDGDDTTPTELVDAPILHYSDPGGITTDGTIWAWGTVGRPVALASIFYERQATGDKWSCELLSLHDGPLSVAAGAGWKWHPPRGEIQMQSLPNEPDASDQARRRSRQMKEIARRFEVSETFSAERTDQLRLMVRALHEYSDPDRGLLAGALYAYANGTNPEALVIIECRRPAKGEASWKYGFARLGAAQVQASLNGAQVWQCSGIERWNAADPYFSVFGPEAAVFRVGDLTPPRD